MQFCSLNQNQQGGQYDRNGGSASPKYPNFNRSNSEKNSQGSNVWLGTPKKNSAQVDALYKNDSPLKLADKESLKIIAKIVNKYTGGTMGCIRVIYFEYDLIIKIKEGRYKYEITNFTYTHYNQATGKQSQIYGLKDDGPCKSKGDLNELISCDHCNGEFEKLYKYLTSDISKFLDDMKSNIDKKANDNW